MQIQTTGDIKKMSDSMSVLMTAILLSLLFIYLALTLLYNNWTDPLVVISPSRSRSSVPCSPSPLPILP